MWFQALFHSPPRGAFHLSLTVLVHYRSHGSPLALEGGPPSFTPDYSSRALLRNTTTPSPSPSPTGLSPAPGPRSRGLRLASLDASVGPTTPHLQRGTVWAGSGSLAATSEISVDFSSPRVLRCFSSPGLPHRLRSDDEALQPRRVAPFGHPGINACVPLPLAYRSLPRPSSPPCAQASPTCLRSLDYQH